MAKTLLVDIGNTSVKWAVLAPGNSLEMCQQRYPHSLDQAFFTELWKNENRPNKVLVSCVASSHVWQALEDAVSSLWNIKAQRILSEASGYGVINAYAHPSELGSDRWCALIGAFHAVKSNLIIVDCGSAITIDVANQDGEHQGGYILPGASMMKQSLGRDTAQVKVENHTVSQDSMGLAKSTTGCVNAAVSLAVVSFIETAVAQQLKNMPVLTCLLTGGDAGLIAQHLTIEYVMMPDLILRGLAYMAEHESA